MSPAKENKASPHQRDLTDSVPGIALSTGVGLNLPGLASLGHRERVWRGAWQGQSTSRAALVAAPTGPVALTAGRAGCGQAPICAGQLQAHVCTAPRQPTYTPWHQVTAACILRLLLQKLSQKRALQRGCTGARTDPGDGMDAVTRSPLPCEVRCRRAGNTCRGKAFDLTTSPRAARRTPLPLGYPIV